MTKLNQVIIANVESEMFEAGRSNEDNSIIIGTRYNIIAETKDGFRFRHAHSFCSGEMICDEFNHWSQDYESDMDRANYLANRVTIHLMDGGRLNPHYWSPVQGAYGSAGWDEQAEIELEAEEA